MKTYRQGGDVFAFVADFHRQIKEVYERLGGRSGSGRVEMLLSYLGRHEKRFAESLSRLGGEGTALAETWFQYIPKGETLNVDGIDLESATSTDEVVRVAMELDDRLIAFFKMMAGQLGVPAAVKEIFGRLVEQEEREKAKTVEVARGLKAL